MTNKEAAEILVDEVMRFRRVLAGTARRADGKSLTRLNNACNYIEAMYMAIEALDPGKTAQICNTPEHYEQIRRR